MNFMDSVRRYDRCEWCGRDKKRNRRGLCRSCDAVRRQLDSLVAQTQGRRDAYLDWDLRVTRQMKKDCIAWGEMLKPILGGAVSPLRLEHDFRGLTKCLSGGRTFLQTSSIATNVTFWLTCFGRFTANKRVTTDGIGLLGAPY
jgi:hypothetical protein